MIAWSAALLHLVLLSSSLGLLDPSKPFEPIEAVGPREPIEPREPKKVTVAATEIPEAMREQAPNIWVQQELRETVVQLWRDSPTFREQVSRIGRHAGGLHVTLVLADAAAVIDRSFRAECTLRQYESGLLIARVKLRAVTPALHELIPHELEHICERLDGIDVTRLAVQGRNGFFLLAADRVETSRAINAGRRARAEMHQAATLLTSR